MAIYNGASGSSKVITDIYNGPDRVNCLYNGTSNLLSQVWEMHTINDVGYSSTFGVGSITPSIYSFNGFDYNIREITYFAGTPPIFLISFEGTIPTVPGDFWKQIVIKEYPGGSTALDLLVTDMTPDDTGPNLWSWEINMANFFPSSPQDWTVYIYEPNH